MTRFDLLFSFLHFLEFLIVAYGLQFEFFHRLRWGCVQLIRVLFYGVSNVGPLVRG